MVQGQNRKGQGRSRRSAFRRNDALINRADDGSTFPIQHIDPDPVAEAHERYFGFAVADCLDRSNFSDIVVADAALVNRRLTK